jgi:Ca-activated chloride channel family protein
MIILMIVTAQEKTWKLEELAEKAGVSPRTVRYYVQRGLLPAPVFKGRDTVYGAEHLVRLKAIRKLQDKFLPLDAIQAELARRSADELRRLAEGKDTTTAMVTVPPPIPPPPQAGPPYRTPPYSFTPRADSQWTRYRLAEGLELHLSEAADDETRALAEEIRNVIDNRLRTDGGSR